MTIQKDEAWAQFEDYIARLYESLGYHVVKNSSIGGQQIDLIAERYFQGIGLARLFIECKYHQRKGVSNQEIYDFKTAYGNLRVHGKFTNGVLVTNTKFTKDARAAASAEGPCGPIHLRIVNELEDEILNLSESLHSYVVDYEASKVAAVYVPLEAIGSLPHSTAKEIPDIEAEILKWVTSNKPGFLTILADFGAGKTTLIERVKYDLCKAKIDAELQNAPIPVFFPLRELRHHGSLDEYIESVLQREFKKTVPVSIFWKFIERGLIVVLLDGFDEIDAKTDARSRQLALHRLSPLITRNKRATILTCRPQFFVSASEHRDLIKGLDSSRPYPLLVTALPESETSSNALDKMRKVNKLLYDKFVAEIDPIPLTSTTATTVFLRNLTEEQIKRFLSRYDEKFRSKVKMTWQQVRDALGQTYDLSDLVCRPFLLEMIVQTILTGQLDELNGDSGAPSTNAASLYEIYTSTQLEIEASDRKGRTLLSADERRQFAELLALEMLDSGYGGVRYANILKLVESRASALSSLAGKLEAVTHEEIATDVRLCAFLTRNNDDEFCFVHKSFMEFFVARNIRFEIDGMRDLRILRRQLPPPVIYFLGSFLALDERLKDILIEAMKNSSSDALLYRRNMFATILQSGRILKSVFFEDLALDDSVIPSSAWTWVRLSRVNFVSTTWRALSVTESTWEKVEFTKSGINSFSAINSNLDICFNDSTVGELDLQNSEFTAIASRALDIERAHVTGGSFTIDGLLRMGDAKFTDASVSFGGSGQRITFSSATFERCRIETAWKNSNDSVRWASATLRNCTFFGLSARNFLVFKTSPTGRTVSLDEDKLKICCGTLFLSGADADVVAYVSGLRFFGSVCIVDLDACLRDAVVLGRHIASISSQIGGEFGAHLGRVAGEIGANKGRHRAH